MSLPYMIWSADADTTDGPIRVRLVSVSKKRFTIEFKGTDSLGKETWFAYHGDPDNILPHALADLAEHLQRDAASRPKDE